MQVFCEQKDWDGVGGYVGVSRSNRGGIANEQTLFMGIG